jgi:uncharacterized protein YbjT (DUF2867 family)
MDVVVIGGTGRIGSKLIAQLIASGHSAVPAAPSTGVNTVTGEGLEEALSGADTVVDVSNAPSWEDDAVLDFFTTSTSNLLRAERRTGVGRHVALSIVGAAREPDSGYLRAKVAQEELIAQSGQPYAIVRSTQFFEFVSGITDAGTRDDGVHLTDSLFQPIAADDVVTLLADIVVHPDVVGVVEIGGPEAIPLDELARRSLRHRGDARPVFTDRDAPYFGARVQPRSLVPGSGARLGTLRFDDWLVQNDVSA